MFAFRIRYLMGRVYASSFDDGDQKFTVEWPPHPSRLFSALVHAWGEGGGEAHLMPALEWLEKQPPPVIHASEEVSQRDLVQAFVPVNDAATHPERRPRKGRMFPSATPGNPTVYYVYAEAPPADIRGQLDALFLRTSSLGHSSSLIAIDGVSSLPEDVPSRLVPHETSGERLRIPYPGRFAELRAAYTRFQENPAKFNRPSRGKTQHYHRLKETRSSTPSSIFDRMVILRYKAGPRASLVSALSLTQTLRKAMLKNCPQQPPPEFLPGMHLVARRRSRFGRRTLTSHLFHWPMPGTRMRKGAFSASRPYCRRRSRATKPTCAGRLSPESIR